MKLLPSPCQIDTARNLDYLERQKTKKITASDALELSIPERIQLVEDIWDTIAVEADSLDLTEQEKQHLHLAFTFHTRVVFLHLKPL